jgi:hypothetical protein
MVTLGKTERCRYEHDNAHVLMLMRLCLCLHAYIHACERILITCVLTFNISLNALLACVQARVPISAADVARLMESMGVDRVIAVDLHCGQIQGFFGPRVPVDNLDGGIVGLDYFGCKDLHKPVSRAKVRHARLGFGNDCQATCTRRFCRPNGLGW